MVRDVEGTQRKIIAAATTEFVANGPDGTTVERIAKLAGVNKERIYNYFGTKQDLFSRVLQDELGAAGEAVALERATPEGVADYAGRLFDYHRNRPDLVRLLLWEALNRPNDVANSETREAKYRRNTAVLAGGQESGALDQTLRPEVLNFLVLSLCAYWAAVPQVAQLITAADDIASRRAGVETAARRMVAPTNEP